MQRVFSGLPHASSLSDEQAMWTRPLSRVRLFCVNCNVCLADSTTTLLVVDSPFTALLGLLLILQAAGRPLNIKCIPLGEIAPSMYVL